MVDIEFWIDEFRRINCLKKIFLMGDVKYLNGYGWLKKEFVWLVYIYGLACVFKILIDEMEK